MEKGVVETCPEESGRTAPLRLPALSLSLSRSFSSAFVPCSIAISALASFFGSDQGAILKHVQAPVLHLSVPAHPNIQDAAVFDAF